MFALLYCSRLHSPERRLREERQPWHRLRRRDLRLERNVFFERQDCRFASLSLDEEVAHEEDPPHPDEAYGTKEGLIEH